MESTGLAWLDIGGKRPLNANNQPYDLDIVDPIVVKEYRSVWSFIIPAGIGIVALWYLLDPTKNQVRLYMKGQWLGETGMFPGLEGIGIGAGLALVSLLICVFGRKEKLGFGSVAIFTLLFFGQFLVLPNLKVSGPEHRFKSEVAEYKSAISINRVYGDQFSEQFNGRKLTYWRWAQIGIDDAVGVIYDPENRYDSADSRAFRKQSHGGIWRIRKMEPYWYIVWHT